MNFNTDVDKDFVDSILESSLWKKAQVNVAPRETVNESSEEGELETVPELENETANRYEEPTDLEVEAPIEEEAEEEVSFSLEDLQVVLDNLADEDLMEHAMSMLDVFDVAYEQLAESEEEEEEEEEE
jgi:hypothetical protein